MGTHDVFNHLIGALGDQAGSYQYRLLVVIQASPLGHSGGPLLNTQIVKSR
jgi:hypothetical protein